MYNELRPACVPQALAKGLRTLKDHIPRRVPAQGFADVTYAQRKIVGLYWEDAYRYRKRGDFGQALRAAPNALRLRPGWTQNWRLRAGAALRRR